jgi:hypothetical protein
VTIPVVALIDDHNPGPFEADSDQLFWRPHGRKIPGIGTTPLMRVFAPSASNEGVAAKATRRFPAVAAYPQGSRGHMNIVDSGAAKR